MAAVLFIGKPSNVQGGGIACWENGRKRSPSPWPFLVWAHMLDLGSPAYPKPQAGMQQHIPGALPSATQAHTHACAPTRTHI